METIEEKQSRKEKIMNIKFATSDDFESADKQMIVIKDKVAQLLIDEINKQFL